MVISSSKQVIYPNQMCDISKQQGFRTSTGTSPNLFSYAAQR
jgi:hypothetical protein